MKMETLIVIVLVLLLTTGWGVWIRPLPVSPAWWGGSLLWFVIVLVLILWLLGVPTRLIK